MNRTDWETFRPVEGKDYRKIKPGHRVEPIVMRRGGPRLSHEGLNTTVNLRQTYKYHSEGFEWGYGGSGPADLALNVLALLVEPPEAYRLHQRFKAEVIARVPEEGGTILMEDVEAWIRGRWAEEDADAMDRETW